MKYSQQIFGKGIVGPTGTTDGANHTNNNKNTQKNSIFRQATLVEESTPQLKDHLRAHSKSLECGTMAQLPYAVQYEMERNMKR